MNDDLRDDDHKDEFDNNDGMFHPDQVPRLSEDGARPAAAPTDIPGGGQLSPDDPLTDSDMDQDEIYNEGIDAASGASTTIQDSDTIQIVDDEGIESNNRVD